MFAPAQLLRNWHEQRPSNKGDFDSSVPEDRVGEIFIRGGTVPDFIFVP
jgi:hypothetical protein